MKIKVLTAALIVAVVIIAGLGWYLVKMPCCHHKPAVIQSSSRVYACPHVHKRTQALRAHGPTFPPNPDCTDDCDMGGVGDSCLFEGCTCGAKSSLHRS